MVTPWSKACGTAVSKWCKSPFAAHATQAQRYSMRSGSAEVVVSIFCFIVYGVFGEGLAPKSLQRYNIFLNYAREGAIFIT
jgi:hypothetical protein